LFNKKAIKGKNTEGGNRANQHPNSRKIKKSFDASGRKEKKFAVEGRGECRQRAKGGKSDALPRKNGHNEDQKSKK